MATYQGTVVSDRTPEDAFAYVVDLRNSAEWDPSIVSATVEGHPLTKGARYTLVLRAMGRERKLIYELQEIEYPRRAIPRADFGKAVSEDEVLARPAAAGSEVTYIASLEPKGPLRILDPLLAPLFRRYAGKAHAGLKAAIGATR